MHDPKWRFLHILMKHNMTHIITVTVTEQWYPWIRCYYNIVFSKHYSLGVYIFIFANNSLYTECLLMRHAVHVDFVVDRARNGQFEAVSYGGSWVKIWPAISTYYIPAILSPGAHIILLFQDHTMHLHNHLVHFDTEHIMCHDCHMYHWYLY